MQLSTQIVLKRTDSENADFKYLFNLLDEYLAIRNGDTHSFYAPNNKLDYLETVIVAYINDLPVGCGCFKKYNKNTVEIKRMYTDESARGKGIASKILTELELWAKEKGFLQTILETGVEFEDAVALYKKMGYRVIENYEPYVNAVLSICLAKNL